MLRIWLAGAVTIAALLPTQVQAQSSGEVRLHGKGHFKGPQKIIAGPRQYIDPPFLVKSVTIPPGTQWELCSGNTYSGCRQFSKSDPGMVMSVRSVRPVAAILSGEVTADGQPLRGNGRSLRGLASEYFVFPETAGNRIEVAPGTAEAMTRGAGDFCHTRGWRTSAHERLQTVGGRFYLADVLCVNDTGR
ncbi:MAG: hypothetical protein ABIW03_05895 [Sphingomicrobium sp.]